MKRIFPVFLISLFVYSAHAQLSDFPLGSMQTRNVLFLTSDFHFGSNALTYELAKTYFVNGFITDKMKDQVSKHLDDLNRIGGEFSTEIYYRHTPDSMFKRKNWSWFTGVKNIDHVHSKFPRDLFEVYFRGNKNYEGKTADFSGFNYLLLKYQQVQFGLSKLILKDSAIFEAGAAVGFNMGQQLFRFESGKIDLYTENFGTYFDVNASVDIHASDSLHKNFGAFNGFGISTDLFFNATIREKHQLFFKISNLGFIRWNDHSAEINADTSFRFEGIAVNELFNFTDTIKTSFNADSIAEQSFLTHRKYHGYTLFLPAKIEISYKRPLGHHHLRAGIGANYILTADYLPQVHLDLECPWNKNMITFILSYGGYTDWGTGLFYRHHFSHRYVLILGSNYLNSLFDLNKSRAQHLGITIFRNF